METSQQSQSPEPQSRRSSISYADPQEQVADDEVCKHIILRNHSNWFLQLYDVCDGSLSTWGLCINRRLHAFICMECECVVPASTALNHITKTHQSAHLQVDNHHLNTIISQENIVSL